MLENYFRKSRFTRKYTVQAIPQETKLGHSQITN